jgi:hypothetical protein
VNRASVACALLLPLAACQPTMLAAHNSVNPVLLGPVKALRSADVPLERAGAFSAETMTFTASSSDGSSTQAASSRSAATEVDWAVVGATSGDPRRTVRLESVTCGGWAFFMLVGLWSMVTCEAKGSVFDPPPGVASIETLRRRAAQAAAAKAAAPPPATAPVGLAPATETGAVLPAPEPPVAPAPAARRRSNVVPPPPPPILQ